MLGTDSMREKYEMPHPQYTGRDKDGGFTYKPQFLPDFITVRWTANGKSYEAEVNPDRVLDFMEQQEKILGGIDDWEMI